MAQKEKNHFITKSYQKQWYSTGTNANLGVTPISSTIINTIK